MSNQYKGWAVQIVRKDGSAFFASPAAGFATRVWVNRPAAVAHRDDLRNNGFKARVVKVLYTEPAVIGPKSAMKAKP